MSNDDARAALRVPRDVSRDESAVANGIGALSLGSADQDLQPHRQAPKPPPPPNIMSAGVISTDITSRFTAATSTLEPGEIIKDGYFTLFESLGALEIMDPKMDSGCVSTEELGDSDDLVVRPLLPAEVVGIIDQLLCLEMAWHLGYPLSQTLVTSVYVTSILTPPPASLAEADYMHKNGPVGSPRAPEHTVLRAYCIALIKTCGAIIETVKNQVYYEEEDLATNTYELPLFEDATMDEIRQVLQEARVAILDATDNWPNDACLALEARLDFRQAFLMALEVAELRASPDALRVPWAQMAASLKRIKGSHSLGIAVPESFNTKMQSLLASTMPPRPIVQPSFDETIQKWSLFAEDGAEAVGILNYEDSQSLLNFVLTFQAKKPQPLVYIRCLLQAFIFTDNVMLGQHSIRRVMDDDLATVVLPSSLLLDPANDEVEAVHNPRFVLSQHMEEFRIKAFPAYLEIYRVLCQNRSRSRRMMCHLIQEWERVQMDVEEIDALVQTTADSIPGNPALAKGADSGEGGASGLSLPLSSWAFLYKIRLMEWVVQLGFELEIYQPDELAGMYWYLCYLSKRRVQHAERIRSFTLRSLGALRQNGGTITPEQETAYTRSLLYLRASLLGASVTWELADALSCIYAALQRMGLLKVPSRPYGTDELRYELRMKPFATIGLPALPSFEMFKAEAEQANNNVAAILKYAEQALGGAKKGCEAMTRFSPDEAFAVGSHARWLASTKNMHKSVIFASLAVAALKKEAERVEKQCGNDDAAKVTVQVPTPDKCYHAWWIVPKITAVP